MTQQCRINVSVTLIGPIKFFIEIIEIFPFYLALLSLIMAYTVIRAKIYINALKG